jgi:hypothetical protein
MSVIGAAGFCLNFVAGSIGPAVALQVDPFDGSIVRQRITDYLNPCIADIVIGHSELGQSRIGFQHLGDFVTAWLINEIFTQIKVLQHRHVIVGQRICDCFQSMAAYPII